MRVTVASSPTSNASRRRDSPDAFPSCSLLPLVTVWSLPAPVAGSVQARPLRGRGRLGKERERGDVRGPDDGEVAAVQRGDPLLAVAFGECDEAGVGAAQAQVGVLDDQVVDALPVLAGERFDAQLALGDRLVEGGLDLRSEFTGRVGRRSRR